MKVRHFLVKDWSGERGQFHGFLLEHQSPMQGDWKPAPQHGYYQEHAAGGQQLWHALSYFAKWYVPDIHSIGVNEWDAITADYNPLLVTGSLTEFLAPVILEELVEVVKAEIDGYKTKEQVKPEAMKALRTGVYTLPADAPIGLRDWIAVNANKVWAEATTEWVDDGTDVFLAYVLAKQTFDETTEDFDRLDFHLPHVVNWDVGGDDEQWWTDYIKNKGGDIMRFSEDSDLRHHIEIVVPAMTISAGLDYNKALELFREQR